MTDQDLPKNFSFNLTTNYFEFIIPALYQVKTTQTKLDRKSVLFRNIPIVNWKLKSMRHNLQFPLFRRKTVYLLLLSSLKSDLIFLLPEISVNSLVYFNISVLPTVTGDPSTPVFTMGTALRKKKKKKKKTKNLVFFLKKFWF